MAAGFGNAMSYLYPHPHGAQGMPSRDSTQKADDSLEMLASTLFDTAIRTVQPEKKDPEADSAQREGDRAVSSDSDQTSHELKTAVESLKSACERVLGILTRTQTGGGSTHMPIEQHAAARASDAVSNQSLPYAPSETVVEGIFDGQHMRDTAGKQYSIPPNYASKSKLVEGDGMKLTIAHNGSFIYKQIHPIERRRAIGYLEVEGSGEYFVRSSDHRWRVLTASVTYYKGLPGDEVVLLVPAGRASRWGAVENIIKKY